MIRSAPSSSDSRRPSGPCTGVIVAFALLALALAGCGERKKDAAASQTAARINKEEVTVHQINLMLLQQRGIRPEQVDAVSRRILESLIDQELAVQRTRELKLDQEQRVVLQLEAAKREVLARAYAEKIGESVGKPSADEIKQYFDAKPALFRERRVYSIQELVIEAKPEQAAALREQLPRVKSAVEFVDYLRANNFRFVGNQGVRAAEQLPPEVLDKLVTMKDGQMVLLPSPTGSLLIMLVGSRSEPIDEARANPAIEQVLLGDARRKRIESDIQAQRAAAKIEYVGKFAEPAASAGVATPPQAVAPAQEASGISADDIAKGMGIKK